MKKFLLSFLMILFSSTLIACNDVVIDEDDENLDNEEELVLGEYVRSALYPEYVIPTAKKDNLGNIYNDLS